MPKSFPVNDRDIKALVDAITEDDLKITRQTLAARYRKDKPLYEHMAANTDY